MHPESGTQGRAAAGVGGWGMMTEADLRVVGTSPTRPDAVEKVTGRKRYTSDLITSGMVHAKVWRSPLPHARVDALIRRRHAPPLVSWLY
jgi:hypothetical protein